MEFFSHKSDDEQRLRQAVLKGDTDQVRTVLQGMGKIEFPKENLGMPSRFYDDVDAESDGKAETVFPVLKNTVLHDFFRPATEEQWIALWSQPKERNIEILKLLLKHPGVNPNVIGENTRNVLQAAVESNREDKYECLELLLAHGADMFFAGRGWCLIETIGRTPDAGAGIDESLFKWLIKRSPSRWPHDFCNLVIIRADVRDLLFEAIEQRVFLEACGESSIQHGWMSRGRQISPTKERRTVYRLCDYAYKRLPKLEAMQTWGQKWRHIIHEQSSFMKHIWVTLPKAVMLSGAESAFDEWDRESDANACQIASEKDIVVKLLQKEGIDCSSLCNAEETDKQQPVKKQKVHPA